MYRIIVLFVFSVFTVTVFSQSAYERDTLWQQDIDRFKEMDEKTPPEKGGILFIGSSSFRAWDSLEEDFNGYNVLNRAFGGSHLIDIIWYFEDIVLPYEPCQIILYEGDNDIAAGKSPEAYLEDVITFVRLVEMNLQDTKIDIVSTKPSPAREEWSENYRRANSLVRDFCMKRPHLRFIDVEQLMYDEDGEIIEEIFIEDRIHMNEKGYEIWEAVIRPYLSTCGQK
ncbi:MAG: GDSL-type esterase/lipase family protein [Marinilabiliaceae bacterium]